MAGDLPKPDISQDTVCGAAESAAVSADSGRVVIEQEQARSAGGGVRDEGIDRRTAAEAIERELVMMFRRARNVSSMVAEQVHPDLDPASYSLLLMVDEHGPLRGMDVADRTRLDKSTVSRQIATLVELDLLERVPDPDDGRARRIQLSELGRARLEQVRNQRRRHLHGQFASWTTQDLKDMARLLNKLNGMM
ncbi:hypothetical protein GCM10010470_58770 [Saccharopolyspora taberi]|uniref:HTH marR-type domain-containing protein n=1 Tax=Saccharopolyspora taberi TaxID=60895 RepID=A0ABN3VNU1_9PSEU